MIEEEKIKNAFELAEKAFDEVYIEKYGKRLDQMQWPETKLRAIGPMAAEIYRQMNRIVVVTAPEDATRNSVEAMARNLATTLHNRVIMSQTGHEIVVSDDETIYMEAQPEGEEDR